MADLTEIKYPQPIAPPKPTDRVKEKQQSDNQRRREDQPHPQGRKRRKPADDGKPHIDEYA